MEDLEGVGVATAAGPAIARSFRTLFFANFREFRRLCREQRARVNGTRSANNETRPRRRRGAEARASVYYPGRSSHLPRDCGSYWKEMPGSNHFASGSTPARGLLNYPLCFIIAASGGLVNISSSCGLGYSRECTTLSRDHARGQDRTVCDSMMAGCVELPSSSNIVESQSITRDQWPGEERRTYS